MWAWKLLSYHETNVGQLHGCPTCFQIRVGQGSGAYASDASTLSLQWKTLLISASEMLTWTQITDSLTCWSTTMYKLSNAIWSQSAAASHNGKYAVREATTICPRSLWPLTLKVVSKSRVTWANSANFSLPRPVCPRRRPDVRDSEVGQRDRCQTASSLNAPA